MLSLPSRIELPIRHVELSIVAEVNLYSIWREYLLPLRDFGEDFTSSLLAMSPRIDARERDRRVQLYKVADIQVAECGPFPFPSARCCLDQIGPMEKTEARLYER
jgi:hypothetical protein